MTYSLFIVTGDLNGDGIPDIVTVIPTPNEGSRMVVVLLGTGNGGFRPAVSYPLISLGSFAPYDALALEDLNGDGKLDLVVAPGYGSRVAVLSGNGDGTFGLPAAFSAQDYNNGSATGLAAIDVNGDQKIDVLADLIVGPVGLSVSNELHMFLGNGDISLQPVGIQSAPTTQLYQLIPGDFNNDGRVDFVSIDRASSVATAIAFLGSVVPALRSTKTHAGDFTQGQTGASFIMTVKNIGGTSTSGSVTVNELPGEGLQITSMSGNGWTCSTASCSRSDPLSAGSSYSPVTVFVNVNTTNNGQPGITANEASVSGGGSKTSAFVLDTVNIGSPFLPADVSIAVSHDGNFSQGQTGATYSIIVSNVGGTPTAGSIVITDVLPAGLTATMLGGLGWTCTLSSGICSRGDSLTPGSSYPAITVTVNVLANAPSSLINYARVVLQNEANVSNNLAMDPTIVQLAPSRVGVFRSGFYWLQDVDGDQQFNSPPDRAFAFGGVAGDIPITGDWNGSGTSKVGIYRPSNGLFILDTNGDGVFDGGDAVYNLGVGTQAGDVPVVGDWNGDGQTKVGLFREGFFWILDTNGDGVFEQGVDSTFAFGGVAGDVPVVGDWTGSGTSKIGLFRLGFYWILDVNGNGVLDNVNGTGGDQAFAYGGIAGDVPVVGDWNGSGTSKVGVFRQGFFWVLDANGNLSFDGTGPGQDFAFPFGGISGDVPVMGKW